VVAKVEFHCQKCVSASMARRMVLDVFPALRAEYRREQLLTVEQVRSLISDTGRNAAHAYCLG
jgi:hypothetical protein